MPDYHETLEIHHKAREVIYSQNMSWEEKYHTIFSEQIAEKVNIDFNNPDTSYHDDVMAFMNAFGNHLETIKSGKR